ncbi:tetratricopeptide repeat protein, partial [Dactylosporangium sp. NPDC048998]|uniref:tetratricopeptide repeat protein n=1 Tax=Dactylosporangium sp. NPDC048998 TaxID=3363976 RepID=UPI0037157319
FRDRDGAPRGDRPSGFRDRDGAPRGDRPSGFRDRDGAPRGDRPSGFRDRDGGGRGDRPYRDRDGGPRGDRPGGFRGERAGGGFRDRDGGPRGDRPSGYRDRDRDRDGGGRDRDGGFRDRGGNRPGYRDRDGDTRPGGFRDRDSGGRAGGFQRGEGLRRSDAGGYRPRTSDPGFVSSEEAGEETVSRVADPVLADDIDASELDREVRAELSSLARPVAEEVGRRLVAAGQLIDDDPELALAHALVARRKASRIAVVREAAGLAAYHAGEWQTALGELRTYHRMTGRQTHIAVIADCERALGRPEKAIDLFRTADRERLSAEEIVELLMVAAGARGDMGQHDAAVAMLQVRELTSAPEAPWAARLRYAYADALLRAGRREEAREWFARAADLDEDLRTDAAERLLELDGITLDGDTDEESDEQDGRDEPAGRATDDEDDDVDDEDDDRDEDDRDDDDVDDDDVDDDDDEDDDRDDYDDEDDYDDDEYDDEDDEDDDLDDDDDDVDDDDDYDDERDGDADVHDGDREGDEDREDEDGGDREDGTGQGADPDGAVGDDERDGDHGDTEPVTTRDETTQAGGRDGTGTA